VVARLPRNARDRALAVLRRAGEKLTEYEAKQVLSCWGVRCTREAIGLSASATAAAARQMGFPVAVKALSPHLRQKRAAGALALNVRNAAEVRVAFARVLQRARRQDPTARLECVLVCEMLPRGIDMTLACRRERGRARVIFGLGGLLGIAAGASARRPPPVSRRAAEKMLREVPGVARVLDARGDPAALADLLERFADLIVKLPRVTRFDMDVHALPPGEGYVVVDAHAEQNRI